MAAVYLRVWQACDAVEIGKYLIIVGDVTADCAACRELGIAYQTVRECPGCKTVFRFISLRSHADMGQIRRVKERRPDLTFIDYGDYKHATGKQSARDLFK